MSKDLLGDMMKLKDEIEKKLVELNELILYVHEKSEDLMDAIDEYEDDEFIDYSDKDDISDDYLDQISLFNISADEFDDNLVHVYDNDFNLMCTLCHDDVFLMFGDIAESIFNELETMDIVSIKTNSFIVESYKKGHYNE